MKPKPDPRDSLVHGPYAKHFTPAEKARLRQIPVGDLAQEIVFMQAMETRLQALQVDKTETEETARLEYLREFAASALRASQIAQSLITRSQDNSKAFFIKR